MKVLRAEGAARAIERETMHTTPDITKATTPDVAKASMADMTKATTLDMAKTATPFDAARAVTTLDALPFGAVARVVSVNGTGSVVRRLMEMGVVPGAPVRVVKAAPLGDPLEVRVRGYHLALRRAEARTIQVVED